MRIPAKIAVIMSSAIVFLIGMFQLRIRIDTVTTDWIADSLTLFQPAAVIIAHATSPVVLICVALLGTFLAVETHHTYAWLQMAAALVTTLLICWLIKEVTQIARPQGAQLVATGLSEYAFPSTHAATAGMLAVLTAFHARRLTGLPNYYIYSLVSVVAILIGISRIAVRAHTTVDVATGLGFGLSLGLLASLTWPYWHGLLNRLTTRK